MTPVEREFVAALVEYKRIKERLRPAEAAIVKELQEAAAAIGSKVTPQARKAWCAFVRAKAKETGLTQLTIKALILMKPEAWE